MGAALPFSFEANTGIHDAGALMLDIPKGINDKENLFVAYARLANFPSYFGYNWDAFEELLSNLSWVKKHTVVIRHADLPLDNDYHEVRIYLDALAHAVGRSGIPELA